MSKITISSIRKELQEENWDICSEEYKNLNSELVFLCNNGHQVYSTWKKIREKRECPICKKKSLVTLDSTIVSKKKGVTRILALDQATHISGWAIYDGEELIRSGTFETEPLEEIERDTVIKNWLINMICNWKPDIVGIEDIQLQNINGNLGLKTYKVLAHLQGILMQTLFEQNIDYKLCPPGTWRSSCGVKGKTKADMKRSMQMLVQKWYNITVSNDEADAIGIGKYLSNTYGRKIEIINWE